MKSVGEILTSSTAFLAERKIDRPRRSAEELLAAALGLKRIDLYMQYERPLIESELEAMRAFLRRRSKSEPLEYILGKVDFYRCSISVNSDVLIPRPETEILVDLIAKEIKGSSGVLWDLCAGSGCIGLAMKKACPELTVLLSDLCPKALAIARANAELNELEVQCLQGDLLEPFEGQKASFIVCNPPYIADGQIPLLDESVKGFEPHLALAGGPGGLSFYERLAAALPAYLERGAKVYFEIGFGQGAALQKIFSAPIWRNLRVLADWAGHDRFFFLEIE